MLEQRELNELLGDPQTWNSWFNERADNLPEPAGWTKNMRSFSYKEKFKDSSATIYIGLKSEMIAIENVKLSRLRFSPQVGGLTELQLTIQCTPEMDNASVLLDWLDHSADIELEFGEADDGNDSKQPELPLDMKGDQEIPAEVERPSKMQKAISRAATKKPRNISKHVN